MPNETKVARHAFPSLEDQKQAEFSLKEGFKETVGGTLGLITPLVMECNETTELQNPHISHNEKRPGLHASSIRLAESIGGSLAAVHSQTSSSHSSWINTKRAISGEESSSHATFADSASYRFPCPMIHSAPTSQFLGMKNCQVFPQKQVPGDTETVYTGSVEHQRCLDNGGMQNLGTRSHDDTQSAYYKQLSNQNLWINNTLEESRQNLGGLRIIEPGANTPSDEPLTVLNCSDKMNCMHQEIRNGSVGDQTSGSQFTTQDLQGIYENYGNCSCLQNNIGKVQKHQRSIHSREPYSKMTKKARELLKKKQIQIQEQLEFVDKFHGLCPKLVYAPTFSSIQEDENLTPLSPTWPGK